MERDRKIIAIIFLSIAVVVSGIGNIVFFWLYFQYSPPLEEKVSLVVGTRSGPTDLDPLNADDSESYNVIRQVVEGLYMYDYTDPDLPRIPLLAVDEGIWEDNLTWTVSLRDDVWFHDYEKFNATTVKWNFDRLMWFSNATGTLNLTLFRNYPLFELPDGTFIIDEVVVNSEYNITFKLNIPYPPFKELLCHTSCYILSPKSTPQYEYINTLTGDLVGTGPFIYNNYVAGKEVKFSRWGGYWRHGAYFEEIFFSVIYDATDRNNAMLDHEIDYFLDPLYYFSPTFETDFSITISDPVVGVDYNYLKLNNNRINETWRQAISYAINYSFIIEELKKGNAVRANDPIAPAFVGYNSSVNVPSYNLTYAREIVVSMGYGNLSWNDTQWRNANFVSFNYTYYSTAFLENLGILLYDKLDLIGIDLKGAWFHIPYFKNPSFEYPNYYQYMYNGDIHWFSWTPDYLDPMNTFLSLFSNSSIPDNWIELTYNNRLNLAFVNDSWLEQKITQALKETNNTVRNIIYSEIQHYLAEELFPHAFGFHSKLYFVHSADLRNVPYNSFGTFYAWPIYREGNYQL